jgi:hypothetical protein
LYEATKLEFLSESTKDGIKTSNTFLPSASVQTIDLMILIASLRHPSVLETRTTLAKNESAKAFKTKALFEVVTI